jgi:hypothetical protein
MSHHPGIERNGAIVEIGDQVRLLEIRPSILVRLVGAEHSDVSTMLGQVVEVFDVYENGQVWVSAFFPRKDGTTEVHAISVDAKSIELVRKARNG